MMLTVVSDGEQMLTLPPWVLDFDSFLRWCDSDEFPEEGRIWFIRGGVWADMTMEQVFSHNQVKGEMTRALMTVVKMTKSGRFFPDGLRITNVPAELSGVPDGTYVSFDTLRAGRARYVEGKGKDAGGYTQLEGIPDIAIEVVSLSSVDKDTEWLQKAYWEVGIPEYWLIDARRLPLTFDLCRHSSKGYTAARKSGGWVKSAVLGKSFRLSAATNGLGHPDYTLEVR
jgi:Uma2 family endonuclease